ncbi:hypothetical protein QFZ75_000016 [Streptomyces sp. V3I8]|uniref:DUF6233 domain-containing protein n=1 Tax=Streptomyces sp. V3I8 TaxID=3042279 RepID=UPI002787F9A3|nr:DUF6233 domain-containing protein [Streptomyces sp. V3I8]MDQ1033600.1 hypothetical protein [Streptomyces sp. V3I8]
MFEDLPPDPARLTTLRIWHAMWLLRIDALNAAVQRREAAQAHVQRARPPQPDGAVAFGIGDGRRPIEVHAGCCYVLGKRRQAVHRADVRRLLAARVRVCSHRTADITLEIPLSGRPVPATAAR